MYLQINWLHFGLFLLTNYIHEETTKNHGPKFLQVISSLNIVVVLFKEKFSTTWTESKVMTLKRQIFF
jgi:hypothetical protein